MDFDIQTYWIKPTKQSAFNKNMILQNVNYLTQEMEWLKFKKKTEISLLQQRIREVQNKDVRNK